ncbi:MAG: NAD(P)H-dependent glycerol-3-phosphate dehydrogenase [Burkholderiales bacterium]
MNITVLGSGAWGTALAINLAQRHTVTLWGRDAVQLMQFAVTRENQRYLPGCKLPANVRVETDLVAALRDCELILSVVPTNGLRGMLQALTATDCHAPIVWACKGFEAGSSKLPHEIMKEVCGADRRYGVLSGPSFALEVAQGKPAALTLASDNAEFARDLAQQLHGRRLRVYSSTDVIGVELGGALKNVMAIAAGICDGMRLGNNARAALITRGLAEISRLGAKLGGQTETFTGLTGLGDLVLTCTGDLSRNRKVGLELAQGKSLENILHDLGHVAEGVSTAREAVRLAEKHHIDMPITSAVSLVLDGKVAPAAALDALLSRDAKPEALR